MKIKFFGIAALILIAASLFFPVGYVDQFPITLLPVFDNYKLQSYWEWLDVSAFVITIVISIFVNIYLLLKKIYIGLFIITAIQFSSFFFILTALWITSINISEIDFTEFSYSFGLIILLAGIIFNLMAALFLRLNSEKSKRNL